MASAVSRGPLNALLQSAAGQWTLLGAGGYYLVFPEHVRQALSLHKAGASNSIAGSSAASSSSSSSSSLYPQMITIQTPFPSTGTRPAWTMIVYAVAGGAVCWLGYVACTQIDVVAQLLPVTKQVFTQTTSALSRAIWNVKQALEEKLLGVSKKQDELSAKQCLTHEQVQDLHRNLEDARQELWQVRDSLERCEESLQKSHKLQSYTQRGVRLLVRCVTSFLPEDAAQRQDIQRFINEGAETSDQNQNQPSLPAAAAPMARAVSLPNPPRAIESIPEDSCYQESVKTRSWYEETISFENNSSASDEDEQYEQQASYPLFTSPSLRTPPTRAPLLSSTSEPVRPRGTTAILYGQDSPAQVVDIQALLGH